MAESHTNKVYQTLRYFDAGEMKRLLKYVQSPYFNPSTTLAKLCEILLVQLEKGHDGFDRQVIWRKILPTEGYDDVNFRKYCSDLLGLVEGFMAQEMLSRNPERLKTDTLAFVAERKIEPLYNSAMRAARSSLEKQPYRSLDYYLTAYSIERQYYTLMDFDVKVNVRANVEEISTHLDSFFLIEKLKLYCAALSQRKTGNQQYRLDFVPEILAHLERIPIEEIPELAIYYYSYRTLDDEENTEHYYNLRRMLDHYGTIMPHKEAVELYDSALHYCTGRVNKGKNDFYQEYFDLFEDAIQKGIFLSNGELASWRFNNIVAAALRLGRLEWAENFIETHKSYLPADTRQNTYTFNLARVYRFQGKYEKVLQLLHNIEYEDIGYNLISKMMLTITYYELDAYDALSSFMESFRVFLNRHKHIPQQRRDGYLNLLKYVRRLTRIIAGDKASVEKLRTEIAANKAGIVNHEWLLEKLDELK